MALLNLFGKKLKGENQYFKNRTSDSPDEKPPQQVPSQQQPLSEKNFVSDRLINKDLLAELLKTMRSHDNSATVVVLANTTDNATRRPGIMINKGYVPKKIVSYLQKIKMNEIEAAIKLVQSGEPDANGFHPVDERMATNLNLPLGCMILGIFHRMKREFGVILVLKTNLKDKKKFVTKIKKLSQR